MIGFMGPDGMARDWRSGRGRQHCSAARGGRQEDRQFWVCNAGLPNRLFGIDWRHAPDSEKQPRSLPVAI